jgi:nitronate monooxygenase
LHSILTKHDRGTAFTRGFSGKYAEGIRTKFTDHYSKVGNLHILPFPLQNRMTTVVRDDAVARGDGLVSEFMGWCEF